MRVVLPSPHTISVNARYLESNGTRGDAEFLTLLDFTEVTTQLPFSVATLTDIMSIR